MGNKNYFLSVDIGTQSIRVGLIDYSGEIHFIISEDYETNYEKGNKVTQNPEDWWQSFIKCINKINKKIDENDIKKYNIQAMSICATSSTVLGVDKNGEVLTEGIMWMDKRAHYEAEEINNINSDYLKYSGGAVSAEWMVPKMKWLKENRPDIYKKSDFIIEQLDWFNYKLTKKWVVSKCNATCKWNYVDSLGGWSNEFMNKIGLEDYKSKWPNKVLEVGEVIGGIDKSIADKLNLPDHIKIIQGAIDAHTALLGMGITRPKELGMIMGSSFVHLALSENPIFNEGLWGPYENAVINNYWLLEGGQTSGGSINRWFRDNFAKDLKENAFQKLSEEASNIPPGSEGLVVLDFWQGNRTPYKDPLLKGNIYGLRLLHTRGHIYRAILEGVAFGTKKIINTIEKNNYEIDKLIVCGGGSKDNLWLQIISDVTGLDIYKTNHDEAGIMGTAVISAYGTDYYKNMDEAVNNMIKLKKTHTTNKENHQKYKKYYKKYDDLCNKLIPEMDKDIE